MGMEITRRQDQKSQKSSGVWSGRDRQVHVCFPVPGPGLH